MAPNRPRYDERIISCVRSLARSHARDDNCILISNRVTIPPSCSAAGAETGTRHQQWKQQRRRQTAIRSRYRPGGRAGGTLRRISPAWETVRRGIELEDAPNMRLPETARCQVKKKILRSLIVKS